MTTVEVRIIILIGIGFGMLFKSSLVRAIIGVVGGSVLVYLGYRMVRSEHPSEEKEEYLPYHPYIVGIITTLTNPYFFLWWATVGAALIVISLGFGLTVFLVFAVLHSSCDFFWDLLVSFTVFKSRKFWNNRVRRAVFASCGMLMVIFGIWFIASPFL